MKIFGLRLPKTVQHGSYDGLGRPMLEMDEVLAHALITLLDARPGLYQHFLKLDRRVKRAASRDETCLFRPVAAVHLNPRCRRAASLNQTLATRRCIAIGQVTGTRSLLPVAKIETGSEAKATSYLCVGVQSSKLLICVNTTRLDAA
ncbi:hypothetical protein [Thioclava indica]|uniref:hypothetical protein n=1 Tax=Thioclava indica TaxID=1353528 RepID=UPI000AA0DDBA|nr:hypothetical protein [Thioclava indica]